jgi:hypothetical protein
MNSISRKDFSGGWKPSSDAVNCPKNALLRMDNLVLDDRGIIALRKGISAAISAPGTSISNLFTANLNGTRYRMSSAGSFVYANGVSVGAIIPGTGDIQFGSAIDQIFFARSTTKKKYDGTTLRNWGIQPLSAAPTMVAASTNTKVFASMNGTSHASPDSPAWVDVTGTSAESTGSDAVANSALTITPDAGSGQGIITKTFISATDYSLFANSGGSVNDIIQFNVYVTAPQEIANITLVIDCNTGDFITDYYAYSFTGSIPYPAPPDMAALQAYAIANNIPEAQWPALWADIVATYNAQYAAAQAAQGQGIPANTWTRLYVTRSGMDRIGATTGKDWSTVKALKFVVNGTAAGSATVSIDNLEIIGGEESTQAGNYYYIATAVRNADYQIISAPSAVSDPIMLRAQGSTITIPDSAMANLDSQANEIWIYRMGGKMLSYYRVATIILQFDHTAPFESEYSLLSQANYTAAFESSFGGTVGPGKCTATWERTYGYDTTSSVADTMSDDQATAIGIKLQSDVSVPPDDIIGIAGPYYDRLFCMTAKMLWPSMRLKPDSYVSGQVITIGGDDETALWIAQALGGLYIGTTKDIYRLEGTGAEYPDGTMDFRKVPVNIGNPPISSALAREGNSMVYLASDGWRAFTGSDSSPIKGDTDLLWKGETRHGVSPINVTGSTARFRAAIWSGMLVAITPEGSDTTSSTKLHKYNFATQRWYRHVYTKNWTAIVREPDGSLIAGDSAGSIYQLETGTQDDSDDIAVVLWTPVDDGDIAQNEKEAQDLQLRLDTGTAAASVAMHLDGSSTASDTQSVTIAGSDIYQYDVSDIAMFRQIQLRLTGSFSTFKWLEYAFSFIALPATRRAWNLGAFDATERDMSWIRKVSVKANASANMTVNLSFDGVSVTAKTITVTPNVPTVYDVDYGRGIKGRVPKLLITSTADFIPYWATIKVRGSGGETQKSIIKIKP